MRIRIQTALAVAVFVITLPLSSQPPAAARTQFQSYVDRVETRLNQQHRTANTYLVTPPNMATLRSGQLVLEDLTPKNGLALPGAILHHWRGTAFIPNAGPADFNRLLQNIAAYPTLYAPQVLQAHVESAEPNGMTATLRVQQKKVLTVTMDTTYRIDWGQMDAAHGFNTSHSTRVREIDAPGTRNEHAIAEADAMGYLWDQNTYWSYAQADGGVYIQVESISLSRDVPAGLGWLVKPFIQSIPRDTLTFTLNATRNALRKG